MLRVNFGQKFWIIVITMFGIGCFANAVSPEIPKGAPGQWTLQDLLKVVEANSTALERSRFKTTEMKAGTKVANANFLPYIGLQSTISSNEFVLSQKIYDGGAALATARLAEHRERGAKFEEQVEAEHIRSLAIDAFYAAVFAKRTAVFLDEHAAKIDAAMRRVETQFKYRAIGRDVLLRAQVQIRKSRSERFEARDIEAESVRVLSRLTHFANFESSWLIDNLQVGFIAKPEQLKKLPVRGQEFQNLPQRELLKINGQILEDEKDLTLAPDKINVSFNASYGLGQQAPNFSVGYVYAVGFQYGLSLSIPLASGYSIYAKNKVYAERRLQLERDLRILDDDTMFDYNERVEHLKRDWNDLQAILEELSASDEIWKEADANFRLGISSPDLWFEASENVRQWRMRYFQKLRSYLTQFDRINELVQST